MDGKSCPSPRAKFLILHVIEDTDNSQSVWQDLRRGIPAPTHCRNARKLWDPQKIHLGRAEETWKPQRKP